MKLESPRVAGSFIAFVVGWILSAIPILGMGVMGAVMWIAAPDKVAEGMHKYGYPSGAEHVVLALEVGSALLYAIPKTAILGAILITGYLGGAVATHIHASEVQWFIPVTLGVIAWLGVYLRDQRLRSLVPFRK